MVRCFSRRRAGAFRCLDSDWRFSSMICWFSSLFFAIRSRHAMATFISLGLCKNEINLCAVRVCCVKFWVMWVRAAADFLRFWFFLHMTGAVVWERILASILAVIFPTNASRSSRFIEKNVSLLVFSPTELYHFTKTADQFLRSLFVHLFDYPKNAIFASRIINCCLIVCTPNCHVPSITGLTFYYTTRRSPKGSVLIISAGGAFKIYTRGCILVKPHVCTNHGTTVSSDVKN